MIREEAIFKLECPSGGRELEPQLSKRLLIALCE